MVYHEEDTQRTLDKRDFEKHALISSIRLPKYPHVASVHELNSVSLTPSPRGFVRSHFDTRPPVVDYEAPVYARWSTEVGRIQH